MAHISNNNNTPSIAYKHASQALWKAGLNEDIHIHYTEQRTPLYPIVIDEEYYPEDIPVNSECHSIKKLQELLANY